MVAQSAPVTTLQGVSGLVGSVAGDASSLRSEPGAKTDGSEGSAVAGDVQGWHDASLDTGTAVTLATGAQVKTDSASASGAQAPLPTGGSPPDEAAAASEAAPKVDAAAKEAAPKVDAAAKEATPKVDAAAREAAIPALDPVATGAIPVLDAAATGGIPALGTAAREAVPALASPAVVSAVDQTSSTPPAAPVVTERATQMPSGTLSAKMWSSAGTVKVESAPGSVVKDRAAVAQVRSKRKADDETEGSSTESDAGSQPFAAKLVEVQGSGNREASQPHEPDAALLQQVVQVQTAAGTLTTRPEASAPMAELAQAQAQPGAAGVDSGAMVGVSSAQLIQSAGHAEMRLGMQTADFGTISISTSMNHQALSAQISIDHAELGRALSMHLPAIEEKLGQAYGLQARVEVREGSGSSMSADSGQQQQEQQAREDRRSGYQGRYGNSGEGGGGMPVGAVSALTSATASVAAAASTTRLDVRI